MYKIGTLNKISPVGLKHLTDQYQVTEDLEQVSGIIVRSADMHEMTFPDSLLAIGRAGAGVNNIPLDRCAQQGIVVFNAPGANANAVKELVLAGMLLAARNIPQAIAWAGALEDDDVKQSVEKGKGQFAGTEIKGKTLGLIGVGAIGGLVANDAIALGMSVIAYDPYASDAARKALDPKVVVTEDQHELLSTCDYLSLHIPALDSTKGMVDAALIDQMKDGAVILNFARDTLVKEEDLLAALQTGKLSRYVIDFPYHRALLDHPGVIALPHLGASTAEAEDNCASMVVDQLMAYIQRGDILHSVNYPDCQLGEIPDGSARLMILHQNAEEVQTAIAQALSEAKVNIQGGDEAARDDYACTLMNVPADTDPAIEGILSAVDGVTRARLLQR